MDTSIKNSRFKESTLIWAVVCSILLHVLLVTVIPKFEFDSFKKMPDVLKVELVQPKKPEPIPAPIPEKIEPLTPEKKLPEPIKPKEIKPKEVKPAPIKKVTEPQPEPKTEQVKSEPEPKQETRPEPVQAEPQVPKVIAVEPKPEAKIEEKPAFVAPAPQPQAASSEDIGAARSAYIKSIHQELKRNHRYPKMAERNGISGEVKVEIKFDNDGNVVSTNVVESSGNASLDEGALATVKRSNFKQYMKQVLVGQIDTITVPIVFTLASQ